MTQLREIPVNAEVPSGIRIIYGLVDVVSGVVTTTGSGFTVSRTGTGDFTITFSTAFASADYVVTVGLRQVAAYLVSLGPTRTTTTQTVLVRTTGNTPIDSHFSFIAIGPA
jgi:hypothetical protein